MHSQFLQNTNRSSIFSHQKTTAIYSPYPSADSCTSPAPTAATEWSYLLPTPRDRSWPRWWPNARPNTPGRSVSQSASRFGWSARPRRVASGRMGDWFLSIVPAFCTLPETDARRLAARRRLTTIILFVCKYEIGWMIARAFYFTYRMMQMVRNSWKVSEIQTLNEIFFKIANNQCIAFECA